MNVPVTRKHIVFSESRTECGYNREAGAIGVPRCWARLPMGWAAIYEVLFGYPKHSGAFLDSAASLVRKSAKAGHWNAVFTEWTIP